MLSCIFIDDLIYRRGMKGVGAGERSFINAAAPTGGLNLGDGAVHSYTVMFRGGLQWVEWQV